MGIFKRKEFGDLIQQGIAYLISNTFERAFLPSFVTLFFILWVLFLSLIRAYQKYKKVEQEEEAERLRNDLRSHYQFLVKNRLVEEIIRNIMLALEAEEQRIDKIINTAKQRTEQTSSLAVMLSVKAVTNCSI